MRAMLVTVAVMVLCGCDGVVPFGDVECEAPDVRQTPCRAAVDVAGEDFVVLCLTPVPNMPIGNHRYLDVDVITPD